MGLDAHTLTCSKPLDTSDLKHNCNAARQQKWAVHDPFFTLLAVFCTPDTIWCTA